MNKVIKRYNYLVNKFKDIDMHGEDLTEIIYEILEVNFELSREKLNEILKKAGE